MRKCGFRIGAMLLVTLLLASCAAPGQGPRAWLDRPLDGSKHPLGSITILAHASDADGVASFEFLIDQDSLGTIAASGGRLGEATIQWTPTQPGVYTVGAKAIDGAGNVGSEATSVITVGDLPEASPTLPPEPSQEGEIIFFVEPDVVPPGECAGLHWEVNPPAEALLDGEGVPPAGEREVCPDATTTYELFVPERNQSRTATVHVEGTPEEMAIIFVVDPDAIPQGQCAMLRWEVAAPEEWPTFLDGGEVPQFGEREVCPPSTTSYELRVEAPDGPQVRTVTLHVEPTEEPTVPPEPTPQPPDEPTVTPPTVPTPTSPPGCPGAPVIAYFNANPSTINAGQSSTLDWGPVTNGNSSVLVRSVVIQPGLGEVGSPGQRVVSPGSTTTYTMIATGCGGETRQQVTVNVNPAVSSPDLAITDLRAEPPSLEVRGDITNRGPGTVSNVTVQLSCQWDEYDPIEGIHNTGQLGPMPIFIGNLSQGQTQVFNTDITVRPGQYQVDFACSMQVPYNDPNPGNNSYSEQGW